MKNKYIVLLFPKSGRYDQEINDLPLSLLFASRVCIENGYEIEIIDQRVDSDWEKDLKECAKKNPLLVGISSMTGPPIYYSLQMVAIVKEANPEIPIVWGGIHPTICPEQTLENEYVDFVIKGYGERALYQLAEKLLHDDKNYSKVVGLTYSHNGSIKSNPKDTITDWGEFPRIPYYLVDFNKYKRFSWDMSFSILTSVACPAKCTFCYEGSFHFKEKWTTFPEKQILDDIKENFSKYPFTSLSLIDSEFFVDMKRSKSLLYKLKDVLPRKEQPYYFYFRGVRANDLYRMDDELLTFLDCLGIIIFYVGVESVSPRIQKLLRKPINVEKLLIQNRRFSKYKNIRLGYNFMTGIPEEGLEDLEQNIKICYRLVSENKLSFISGIAQFMPYPGTELYNYIVKKYNYLCPESLIEWSSIDGDVMDKMERKWVKKELIIPMELFNFIVNFLDYKIEMYYKGVSLKNIVIRLVISLYRHIARIRFKRFIALMPFELLIKKLVFLENNAISKTVSKKKNL